MLIDLADPNFVITDEMTAFVKRNVDRRINIDRREEDRRRDAAMAIADAPHRRKMDRRAEERRAKHERRSR